MSKTFRELLIDVLPRLRPYAITLTHDRALADDLVQEAAVRALAAQHQFTMGTNFSAWMYRILRNEFINWTRQSHRKGVSIDQLPETLVSYAERQEDHVLVHELGRALSQLPRTQSEALILICASGLSYEEAANVMNCSIGTIKSRVWRAREQMEVYTLGSRRQKKASTSHPRTKTDRAIKHAVAHGC